jgi:uncharacterized protein (UPF0335 family)
MARKRKSDIADEQPATIGHNGSMPPADVLLDFTHRVENLYDELASEKGEYMNRARQIRESIARVLVEAKDAGIPKKEFKTVIKARQLENKLERIRDELEPDEVETFDQIRLALGDYADTPLGAAALAQAGDRPAA